MKKTIPFWIFLICLNFSVFSQGTIPRAFKYQGVARDASGKPYADMDLTLRMSLKSSIPPGTTRYQEIHRVRSGAQGIFNLEIGRGTNATGSLDSVPWASGNVNLQVELSLNNGVDWVPMGESNLLSVPYAWYAGEAFRSESSRITDQDGDTEVQTEGLPDEDVIRFYLKGIESNNIKLNQAGDPRIEFSGVKPNIAIGREVLSQNVSGIHNLGIGYNSLFSNLTGSENCAFGNSSLENNTIGVRNTALGHYALKQNSKGNYNTAIGNQSLMLNDTGFYNVAVGVYAMQNNRGGNGNSALGSNALFFNTSGGGNTALGGNALYQNLTGSYNTAVGIDAMRLNNSGSHNVAVGNAALLNTINVSAQVAVGDSALFHNGSGYTNTAVGYSALHANVSGFGNTAIGFTAGIENTLGSFNTFLGRETGANGNNYNNTTALGAQAKTTRSNQIVLGNSSVTSIGGFVNWTNFSDKRYKRNVKENVPGLDFVMALKPVTYQLDVQGISKALGEPGLSAGEQGLSQEAGLIQEGREQKARVLYSGFLAQDVEAAARALEFDFSGVEKPESENGFYGLRYSDFVPSMVKAIQEQQTMIQKLSRENLELKRRLETLEAKLSK